MRHIFSQEEEWAYLNLKLYTVFLECLSDPNEELLYVFISHCAPGWPQIPDPPPSAFPLSELQI